MGGDSKPAQLRPDVRRTPSRMERALTLGTALAVGFALVPESPELTLAGAIALLIVTLLACRWRSPAVLRIVVMADLLVALFCLYVFAGWAPALVTTLFVVAPAVVGVVLHRFGMLHPIAPWLRWGALTLSTIAVLLAVIVASVIGLVIWTRIAHPDVSQYLSQLPSASPGRAFIAIAGFSLVNAAWEEMLFRGVLLTELVNVWGPRVALVIESISFGISHANGFPSGPAGVVMAVVWGYLLGVVRVRTGGIGFPFVAHVIANATIALLVYLYL